MSQVKPPVPQKVSDLKQKILNPSLTSHYLMNITPPGIGGQMFEMGAFYNTNTNFDSIEIACSEASLPGSSLATIDISNDYRGISEKHAYRRLYDDTINFTFYVDATAGKEYYVIKFFEAWMAYITNLRFPDIQKSTYDYRVKFPESYYARAMSIQKFERNFGSLSDEQKPSPMKYEFYNAYPLNLNSIPVSYDGSEVLKCSVDFTFSRYRVSSSDYVASSGDTRNSRTPGVPEIPPDQIPDYSNPVATDAFRTNDQFFRSDSITNLERNFGITEGQVALSIDQELQVQATGRPPSGGFDIFGV